MSNAVVGQSDGDPVALFSQVPAEMTFQAAPGVWPMVLGMLPPPCRVLDIGAGRGGLSWILDRCGYEVSPVDLHPEHFLAPDLQCLQANAQESIPFADRSFDLIVAVEIIEHLENPWKFLRECLRVLRDDGQLIITSPNVTTLMSRLTFLLTGALPYFREESFVGCYHVTPVFPWMVDRACRTAGGKIQEMRFSRVDWPRRNDVPHRLSRVRSRALSLLPKNSLTGEITAYRIRKDSARERVTPGLHYK